MDSPRGDDSTGLLGRLKWVLTTDDDTISYAREVIGSIAAVLLVGVLLFGVSGVWPPMVAIESPSMEPNIQTGDLVFVMEEHRLAGPNAIEYEGESTGVVPYQTAAKNNYYEFNEPGDVIIYSPNGNDFQTPIIHRARFWVEDGENWYSKADERYIGDAENCDELTNCPAPHAGFITKGDNVGTNGQYDQVSGISDPVRPSWVVGTAEFRIPYLGYIRLGVSGVLSPVGATTPATHANHATHVADPMPATVAENATAETHAVDAGARAAAAPSPPSSPSRPSSPSSLSATSATSATQSRVA